MGFVDLKRVITEKVGLIPRDICARPHTFELVAVRPPRRGEQDTLVTKTYNTMTTHRYVGFYQIFRSSYFPGERSVEKHSGKRRKC